jgi:hypothetical protein
MISCKLMDVIQVAALRKVEKVSLFAICPFRIYFSVSPKIHVSKISTT